MTIALTFTALSLLALATFAGAFIYAALTCSLTAADVREPAPFVLLRAPTEYRLGAPEQTVRLPAKPVIKVIHLRLDGTQDEAYLKAI